MRPETCFRDRNKDLIGNRMSKIRVYLREKLIRPDKDQPHIFYVDPTPGRHEIHTVDMHTRICTCQNSCLGNICSHILAVEIFKEQVEARTRDPQEGWKRKQNESK